MYKSAFLPMNAPDLRAGYKGGPGYKELRRNKTKNILNRKSSHNIRCLYLTDDLFDRSLRSLVRRSEAFNKCVL